MSRGKYEKRRKKGPILYYALLFLLTAVLLGSLWYLVSYFLDSKEQSSEYDDLAAMVEALQGTASTIRPTTPKADDRNDDAPASPTAPGAEVSGDGIALPPMQIEDLRNEQGILLEYAPLYEMNKDMAGWLKIEGTRINYPVMHTPGRPDYYLNRNFRGYNTGWGCIYAREECDLQTPSDNIILYGHNMKDGSMFAGLHAYLDREFWDEHRYIRFDTITEHHTYEIFAVFTTTASEGQGFPYHDFINAADEMMFDTFISKCLSLSLYGTDIVPVYGDKIICLSTCEYSQTNGRLVIAAVRIS